jgi:hypothetical protein
MWVDSLNSKLKDRPTREKLSEKGMIQEEEEGAKAK